MGTIAGFDRQLWFGSMENDVLAFSRALGYNTMLEFSGKDMNLAGFIKWHLEAVVGHMAELEKLAATDPDISMGVFEHFSSEVSNMLANVLPQWIEKLNLLKKADNEKVDNDGLFISVNPPIPDMVSLQDKN